MPALNSGSVTQNPCSAIKTGHWSFFAFYLTAGTLLLHHQTKSQYPNKEPNPKPEKKPKVKYPRIQQKTRLSTEQKVLSKPRNSGVLFLG